MKHHRVVKTALLVGAFLVAVSPAFAAAAGMPLSVVDRQVSIQSPDGTIEMTVHAQGPLTYSVSVDGKTVLAQSALGLKFQDGVVLGADVQLAKVERNQSDTTWENKFGKRRTVRDRHNELKLSLVEKSGRPFEVIFRAFDDGIGFRYVLPAASSSPTQDFVLEEELTRFAFAENDLCFAGINENTGKPENPVGYIGSQESEYLPTHLADLPTDQVRMLPLLVKTDAAWVAITESDLFDWAGMWVNRVASAGDRAGVTLAARLSPRPDGQGLVKSSFPRNSPWRTLLIAREPGRLIESDLVLNLASPGVPADTSWVKPGIASWDWWSQVTRPSTATFRELIQFSAEMGWAYVLMDAGWSSRNSILQGSPSVNMEELLAFAREKKVRLWLWLHWSSVDRNDAYKEAFALYEKWGIAGVKIDFMNRDDQEMVNWYEKITKAAAEHHLMVNFHGAFKPTGMIRTYPNQITREGILGNEYNRWSARVTPEHKATLPFTRMLAGPADYTPGGFLNKQLDQFKFNVRPTQVQGTRCAELALFVCLESPVINAADHPSHYRDQPGLDFLKIVPTVWDDTRVLDGAVGEHVVIVRRNGDRWFLGALTDRTPRDIPVKLDFLGQGAWNMKLWRDASDSDVEGTHLITEQRPVTAADTLALHMAPAGGAVACFEPASQQAASSTVPVTPDAAPEAVELLNFLYRISGKQTLSGQHNFPADKDKHTLTSAQAWGKTPAVFGKDWGFAREGNQDSAYVRGEIVEELKQQYAGGAIVTMCWHQVPPTADEPVTFQRRRGVTAAGDLNTVQGRLTDAQYKDLLTPGTDLHQRWCSQVDALVPHFKKLEEARVPLLWRPVHEMNGTWFWWGGRTGEYGTAAIYKMMFDRLVKHHKIKNLIWVWSVDRPEGTSLKFEECWPGSEYVDILSLDSYQEFKQSYYEDLLKLAAGKPIALAEVGGNLSLEVLERQPKWTWWMAWAGMGTRGDAPSRFTAIVNAPQSWSLSDPAYRKAVTPMRLASGLPAESPAP